MKTLLITLFILGTMNAWATGACESSFLSKPKFIYTQDLFPIGESRMDESVGYAYHMDEPVIVVQLDLGPGYPRPFLGVFPNDGSEPDLKAYFDLVEELGQKKAHQLLVKDPVYLISQH